MHSQNVYLQQDVMIGMWDCVLIYGQSMTSLDRLYIFVV